MKTEVEIRKALKEMLSLRTGTDSTAVWAASIAASVFQWVLSEETGELGEPFGVMLEDLYRIEASRAN